jgi:hypothetical protein
MRRRPLKEGESRILAMIQEEHGPQNTEQDVFFTDADAATIFIKGRDSTSPMRVVLTNLAAWRVTAPGRGNSYGWMRLPDAFWPAASGP